MALVGRHEETSALAQLLGTPVDDPRRAARLVVLEGPPGVGKTSLWDHAVGQAAASGARILLAQGSEAEALPFGGIVDLMSEVGRTELQALPEPLQAALEVATYRAMPGEHPPAASVLSLAVLSILRALAAHTPVLAAIDDLQWLDEPSADALSYAAKRLRHDHVTFLLTRRPGRVSTLERAVRGEQVHRIEVGPLSLGALRQILLERLDVRLPHHLLRRVYDTTGGNPLFAIEVGRLLAARDPGSLGDSIGEDLPVPDDVEDLLGLRVADLGDAVRAVLFAVSLSAELTIEQVRRVAGHRALEDAIAVGVVEVSRGRVRAAHPLLAAAARRRVGDDERAAAHRALAEVVPDEERRVLHLSLATPEPDEALADRVAAAAAQAAARGATRLAVDLSTHALRLTPATVAADDRLLALAGHLHDAGERQRLTELLAGRVESLPTPADRVRGHLLLAGGLIEGVDDMRACFDRALVAAGDDPVLRGRVLANLAVNDAVVAVRDVDRADDLAAEAARATAGAEPELERFALYAHTWTTALRGRRLADLVVRFDAVEGGVVYLTRHPSRVAGQQHVWRGEITAARAVLRGYRDLAEERAQASSTALARLHLCELELRAGNWPEVRRIVDEWAATTDAEQLHWPMFERCRALLAAGRGDVDDAQRWGSHAVSLAEGNGGRWDWLEARRALGTAALLAHDLPVAIDHLGSVWDHAETNGVLDPGVFPVAPDLVEALVECGDLAAAGRLLDVLSERAATQDHPWAALAVRRGRTTVRVAEMSYDDAAGAELDAVAAAYDDLELAFDSARTRLCLGRSQRRARKWGAARTSLDTAASAFDGMDAPGWAAAARAELERVGARRPTAAGALSRGEQRVAELAARGLSNKEIARALSVTVHTVEFHLGHVYSKLGLRSRVQLAAHFPPQ
ncbi:helix-turn-helix transcriptional regulator [Nocardioides bigeumensis]|uniref:LuxR family transcriptional regulator n=1 Tax=Nocardioides bigeumensis TaxID=433657 RepID=A0ABN2XPD0_9ACTN